MCSTATFGPEHLIKNTSPITGRVSLGGGGGGGGGGGRWAAAPLERSHHSYTQYTRTCTKLLIEKAV